MFRGNLNYLDAATVQVLQEDSVVARKTLEWITSGYLVLDEATFYKVLPRELRSTEGRRLEVDLNLKDVRFVLSRMPDKTYTAGMHVEVEARGKMPPIRMFDYDYGVAIQNYNGKGPLEFPLSFVVLLDPGVAKDQPSAVIDGFKAKNVFGDLICDYRYILRVLDPTCEGTVFEPIEFANRKVILRDYKGAAAELIRKVNSISSNLPVHLQEHFAENIHMGLRQRFDTFFDYDFETATSTEAKNYSLERRRAIELSHGKELAHMNIGDAISNAVIKGKTEGRQEGREDAIEALVSNLGISRKKALEMLGWDDAERESAGIARMNLGL